MSRWKVQWVLFCFLLLSACSWNEAKVIKQVEADLHEKYQSEFTVMEIEASCAKFLPPKCYKGVAIDKHRPSIPFQITYLIDSGETNDKYLQEYWRYQVSRDWEKQLIEAFQLSASDQVMIHLETSNDLPENLTSKEFPHYREQLGKK